MIHTLFRRAVRSPFILLCLMGVLFLSTAYVFPSAHAQTEPQYVPLSNIPGITDQEILNDTDLESFWNALYRICIGVAVVLAIVQIIRGGITHMLTDSPVKIGDSVNIIRQALIGLALVLSPVVILGVINPDILSLKLITSGLTNTAEDSRIRQLDEDIENVSKNITGTYYQRALFSSESAPANNAAAANWVAACSSNSNAGILGQSSNCEVSNTTNWMVMAPSGAVCTTESATASCSHYSSLFTFVATGAEGGKTLVRPGKEDETAVRAFMQTCASDLSTVSSAPQEQRVAIIPEKRTGSNLGGYSEATCPADEGGEGGKCYWAVLLCKDPSSNSPSAPSSLLRLVL